MGTEQRSFYVLLPPRLLMYYDVRRLRLTCHQIACFWVGSSLAIYHPKRNIIAIGTIGSFSWRKAFEFCTFRIETFFVSDLGCCQFPLPHGKDSDLSIWANAGYAWTSDLGFTHVDSYVLKHDFQFLSGYSPQGLFKTSILMTGLRGSTVKAFRSCIA